LKGAIVVEAIFLEDMEYVQVRDLVAKAPIRAILLSSRSTTTAKRRVTSNLLVESYTVKAYLCY